MHIAELNVGRLRAPVDHPLVKEFIDNLDRINALAERMPGFVWRLTGAGNNATDLHLGDDPTMAVNLSVWESVEQLETYVFGTLHAKFYQRRREWFELMERPHFVLWHVPEGHRAHLRCPEGHEVPSSRAASRRSRMSRVTPSTGTRSCAIESRSRTVTAPSSSESTSTVMHHGVPISSWRR